MTSRQNHITHFFAETNFIADIDGYGYSASGLGSSTVDQVLKYTKYSKCIPSTSTGQELIFKKKYLSTSSTSTHIKICSKVMMDIQSRVNFGWPKQKGFPQIMSLLNSQDVHIFHAE